MAIAARGAARLMSKTKFRANVFTYSILDGLFVVCKIIVNFLDSQDFYPLEALGS